MTDALYTLHYAPDNASLVIRLALEELGVPYRTQLVDRSIRAQRAPAYLALNPNGLIPVLETPQGPIFETAAILLWLSDKHGLLGPEPQSAGRGDFLKWLFVLSNTLHPALRMLFYPDHYAGPDLDLQQRLALRTQQRITTHLATLDARWSAGDVPLALALYLGPMLRWAALYPVSGDKSWFQLAAYPHLSYALAALQERPSVRTAARAEGLGPTPFTAPALPCPPEGSAT